MSRQPDKLLNAAGVRLRYADWGVEKSEKAIRHMFDRNILPCVLFEGERRISESKLDAYMERHVRKIR